MRGVAASPVLAFGDRGQLRAFGESLFAGPFRYGSEKQSLWQWLFGLGLCGSDRHDFGWFNMPHRRLMCGVQVQSQEQEFQLAGARSSALRLDLLFGCSE